MKKNYLVYQITNKLNDKIYIGVHVTENVDDNYMGSGTNIGKAIKEFGLENFEKIILYNFDNKEDMFAKESELVNREFIKRQDVYNICLGGGTFLTTDTISVKDKNENYFRVHKEDPKYLSGEVVPITIGKFPVKDKNGNKTNINKNDQRFLSGELISIAKGCIRVKDENGKLLQVKIDDPRYLSGELKYWAKNMILGKYKNDKENNFFMIDKEDPRYLSGEIVFMWNGMKHSEKTKSKIGEKNSIYQKGEGNSQYGKCWIYNLELKECKSIKKEDLNLFIELGWIKGRKMKF